LIYFTIFGLQDADLLYGGANLPKFYISSPRVLSGPPKANQNACPKIFRMLDFLSGLQIGQFLFEFRPGLTEVEFLSELWARPYGKARLLKIRGKSAT
jgi:hypothetical protein